MSKIQFEEQKIHISCKIVGHFVNEIPNSIIHFSFNSFINNMQLIFTSILQLKCYNQLLKQELQPFFTSSPERKIVLSMVSVSDLNKIA